MNHIFIFIFAISISAVHGLQCCQFVNPNVDNNDVCSQIGNCHVACYVGLQNMHGIAVLSGGCFDVQYAEINQSGDSEKILDGLKEGKYYSVSKNMLYYFCKGPQNETCNDMPFAAVKFNEEDIARVSLSRRPGLIFDDATTGTATETNGFAPGCDVWMTFILSVMLFIMIL